MVADAAVADGESVSVRWILPMSGHAIRCSAVARWTRTRAGRRAIGLRFAELPDEARREIRAYVVRMAEHGLALAA